MVEMEGEVGMCTSKQSTAHGESLFCDLNLRSGLDLGTPHFRSQSGTNGAGTMLWLYG